MKITMLLSLCFFLNFNTYANDLFTVHADQGFPVSCFEIFNYDGYENLKAVILQDMQETRRQAIENCEISSGRECKEVRTRTETVEGDKETCFTVPTARPISF